MKEFKIYSASVHKDERGEHVKFYGRSPAKLYIPDFYISETFMTVNHRNVLRGMHFQLDPVQEKLVTCIGGSLLVNVINLNDGGEVVYHGVLHDDDDVMLYIPENHALGYLSLQDNSRMLYQAKGDFSARGDCGIHPLDEELNLDWGGVSVEDIILSERDRGLPTLRKFMSEGVA